MCIMEAMKAEAILHKLQSNITQIDLRGSHVTLSAPPHLTSGGAILNLDFVSLLLRVRPAHVGVAYRGRTVS